MESSMVSTHKSNSGAPCTTYPQTISLKVFFDLTGIKFKFPNSERLSIDSAIEAAIGVNASKSESAFERACRFFIVHVLNQLFNGSNPELLVNEFCRGYRLLQKKCDGRIHDSGTCYCRDLQKHEKKSKKSSWLKPRSYIEPDYSKNNFCGKTQEHPKHNGRVCKNCVYTIATKNLLIILVGGSVEKLTPCSCTHYGLNGLKSQFVAKITEMFPRIKADLFNWCISQSYEMDNFVLMINPVLFEAFVKINQRQFSVKKVLKVEPVKESNENKNDDEDDDEEPVMPVLSLKERQRRDGKASHILYLQGEGEQMKKEVKEFLKKLQGSELQYERVQSLVEKLKAFYEALMQSTTSNQAKQCWEECYNITQMIRRVVHEVFPPVKKISSGYQGSRNSQLEAAKAAKKKDSMPVSSPLQKVEDDDDEDYNSLGFKILKD